MNERLYNLWFKGYESIRSANFKDWAFRTYILIRFRKVSHSVRTIRKKIRTKKYQQAIDYGMSQLKHKTWYTPLNLMKYIAHAYKKLGLIHEANQLSESILLSFSNMSIPDLIQLVHQRHHWDDSMKTTFQFQGGAENLGILIHKDFDKHYFTKIIPMVSFYSNREVEFYERINHDLTILNDYVPEHLSSLILKENHIQTLTLNFIDIKHIELEDFSLVKQFDAVCRAISYKSIPMSQGSYQAMNLLFHDSIMIETLIYKLNHCFNPTELEDIASMAFNKISKLSREIIPEKDYCFSHNDFHYRNVCINKSNHKLVVLDWNTYGWGLKGIDVVKFLCHYSVDFDWFKQNYLDTIENDRKNTHHKMLVFAYIYFKSQQSITIENEIETFYKPAFQYILEESDH